MHTEKIKYTAQFENGRVVAQWIGLDGIPEEGETPDQSFQLIQDQVNKWHQQSNPENLAPGQQGTPIINIRDKVEYDAAIGHEFDSLKEKLDAIPTKEEALAYLQTTDWKLSIEAKNYINNTKK